MLSGYAIIFREEAAPLALPFCMEVHGPDSLSGSMANVERAALDFALYAACLSCHGV